MLGRRREDLGGGWPSRGAGGWGPGRTQTAAGTNGRAEAAPAEAEWGGAALLLAGVALGQGLGDKLGLVADERVENLAEGRGVVADAGVPSLVEGPTARRTAWGLGPRTWGQG